MDIVYKPYRMRFFFLFFYLSLFCRVYLFPKRRLTKNNLHRRKPCLAHDNNIQTCILLRSSYFSFNRRVENVASWHGTRFYKITITGSTFCKECLNNLSVYQLLIPKSTFGGIIPYSVMNLLIISYSFYFAQKLVAILLL